MKALNLLERVLTGTVAAMLGLVAALICWQVFARYVLKTGVYWIEEFSVTAMMWIGLLGSAACVWSGSHMSLELVVKRLPRGARVWIEVIVDVIVALFALFLCTQGWVLAQATMSSRMTSIPLSIGVSYLALPVAGGLMVLFASVRAARKLFDFFAGGDAADAAPAPAAAARQVRPKTRAASRSTGKAKRKRHA